MNPAQREAALLMRRAGIVVCGRCGLPFFGRNLAWHERKAHAGKRAPPMRAEDLA
jgi:hypothetical protein